MTTRRCGTPSRATFRIASTKRVLKPEGCAVNFAEPTMPIPPAVGMSDLFGEPALPAGFRYTADVLSPAEEKDLVGRIEKLPFKPFEFRGYLGNSIAPMDVLRYSVTLRTFRPGHGAKDQLLEQRHRSRRMK